MFKIIVSCILCVAAFCLQASDIIQVSAGTDVIVNGDKFSAGGVERNNTRSTVLDFAGDSTITVNSGIVSFGIIATNGIVTLDLTKIGSAEFTLNNGAVVKGDGRLVVKGRDSLCVGSKTITENNFAPPAGIVNVEYRDSDGNAYDNPEGLILVGRVLEWELPTASRWKMDASTVPCIVHNDSKIIQSMMKGGKVSLENREMWIYEIDALPTPKTPVYVGSGSEMVVILRMVKPDEYFEQSGYNNYVLTNSIEVAEGGVLNLRSHKFTLAGAVTGSGIIRYTETNLQEHWTKIEDATGFSGHISCEWPDSTLKFGNTAFGVGGVSVELRDASSIELGTAVEDGYSGTIRTLTGPESGSATLTLPPGKSGSIYIGSRSGSVSIIGAGFAKSTVTLGSFSAGETLNVDGGTFKYALSEDILSQGNVFALTRTNGRNVYVGSTTDNIVDFEDCDIPAEGNYTIVAKNGVSYRNVPENVNVTVPEDVTAEVSVRTTGKTNIRVEGGNVSVSKAEPNWREKVLFWMDPSKMETVTEKSEYTITVADSLWVKNATYPIIDTMVDAREGYETIKLIKPSDTTTTWPLLITNGVNGLHFVSMGYYGLGNRRIKLYKGSSYGSVKPAFAIMVFGSQFGGGKAVIANESKYFQRGGEIYDTNDRIPVSYPIFANADIATWVNGTSVNPSERGLSGGWEILSFDTAGETVHGLGYNGTVGTVTNSKGQNYGEVLLFSEMPTAEERIAAEKYLAKKWGLANDYNDASGVSELRIDGTGSVVLNDDFAISGSFAGTMDLNGKSLLITDESLPPNDTVVQNEGRLAWFDPEHPDMMSTASKKVSCIYDRGRGKVDGAPFLNGHGRTPWLVDGRRGFGESRNWIDFSPDYYWDEKGTNYGRTVRLNQLPETNNTVIPLFARTVFVVQDSVNGGGTPFLSEVNGGGDIIPRLTKWPSMLPDPGLPIWRGDTAAIFGEGGATYLDGREIDGAVEGFQGRPELLTAVGNRNFTLGDFGYFKYLDLVVDRIENVGEILGEIIVYDSVLGDDVRKQIEAYLMWKWLGVARDGYSVATNMTLTGRGSVTVASKSQMPKFDASFAGAAAFEESAFDFTVNGDGSVTGAIDMGAAALSFPKTCTANVSFADGMKNGMYTLVKGGTFASETSWTLNLRNGGSRIAKIVQNADSVVLEVRGLGTVVTVR